MKIEKNKLVKLQAVDTRLRYECDKHGQSA